MSLYDEFRVFLSPDLQAKGSWNVQLVDCPVAPLAGSKGSVQAHVTQQQLIRMRSRHGWPNLAELKTIGESVWKSLMTPSLEAAFHTCLLHSQSSNRGMRLVVHLKAEEAEPASPGKIRLQELPVEALYCAQQNFLAPNPATPVSRSLQFKADRDPYRVALPLRILVLVATPQDKPGANMQDEKDAIRNALQGLTGPGGAVELEFCEPPTRTELTARLQKRFQILHFIGHGAFDIVGDDPSPRPHLCLEHPNHQSDPVDAETLEMLLLNSDVRLVVLTACSSAAPTPAEEPYHPRAFDGVAQRMIGGASSVSAVVAMQFDLESEAAVAFSRTFYTNLLASGRTLDEIVALCRQALVGEMNAGHRAWVTPVVYWRCKEGKVFELKGIHKSLDEPTQKKLNEIDVTLRFYLKNIADVRTEPAEVQAAAAPLIAKWQQKVDDLQRERGLLLGETLRLRGGRVKAGGDPIPCPLSLRLRAPAQIGNLSLRVRYPEDKVSLSKADAGASTPGQVPLAGSGAPGELTLALQNASQGVQWLPEEYELAVLNFRVKAGVTDPIVELILTDGEVQKDGAVTNLEALSAVLFVI
jgi:hypothetical protein